MLDTTDLAPRIDAFHGAFNRALCGGAASPDDALRSAESVCSETLEGLAARQVARWQSLVLRMAVPADPALERLRMRLTIGVTAPWLVELAAQGWDDCSVFGTCPTVSIEQEQAHGLMIGLALAPAVANGIDQFNPTFERIDRLQALLITDAGRSFAAIRDRPTFYRAAPVWTLPVFAPATVH